MSFLLLNLTSGDCRMKVSLEGLPDTQRSAAWPSSVRAVRCRVKSRNEQDPYLMLPSRKAAHLRDCPR